MSGIGSDPNMRPRQPVRTMFSPYLPPTTNSSGMRSAPAKSPATSNNSRCSLAKSTPSGDSQFLPPPSGSKGIHFGTRNQSMRIGATGDSNSSANLPAKVDFPAPLGPAMPKRTTSRRRSRRALRGGVLPAVREGSAKARTPRCAPLPALGSSRNQLAPLEIRFGRRLPQAPAAVPPSCQSSSSLSSSSRSVLRSACRHRGPLEPRCSSAAAVSRFCTSLRGTSSIRAPPPMDDTPGETADTARIGC
mmetsp:Transcript_87069/g.251498  ORF Transcript_87069/g.251498 Transcript_87069/m.251498 type:complete len:247 (+) Transcript_87069:542-1282(+)